MPKTNLQHASIRIELMRSINAFYDCMADIEYRHYLAALFIKYKFLPSKIYGGKIQRFHIGR